jgi:8-oxo-dGTP pyrophosphatase MutT (NUDIX family)
MSYPNKNKHEVAPAIPSATIILIREHKGRVEVLLSHRPAGMSFAAGAFVFPGGKVEMADQMPVTSKTTLSTEQIGLRRAAIRELKEETGLDLRANNEDEVSVFENMIYFAHWITPEMAPKRFDTHFYLCVAPDDQNHHEHSDEVITNEWHAPEEVLAQSARGEVSAMFPTRLNIQLFVGLKTIEEALAMGRSRNVIPIMPKPFMKEQEVWVSIPIESGYAITEVARRDLENEFKAAQRSAKQ